MAKTFPVNVPYMKTMNYGKQVCTVILSPHPYKVTQILPANKIPNDICMTHINLHAIPNLVRICSVDMFPKCSFNARSILKKLLNIKSYERMSIVAYP